MAVEQHNMNQNINLLLSSKSPNPTPEEWMKTNIKNHPCGACGKKGIAGWAHIKGNGACDACLKSKRKCASADDGTDGFGYGQFLRMLWGNWKATEARANELEG